MKEKPSLPDSINSDKLREVVQEKEAEILTEILDAKRKRTQMIKKAKKKAELLYQEKLEEFEAKIKATEEKLQTRINEIMQMLERREHEYLEQMEEYWKQRKEEALNTSLKRILP
ncbi:MAG: hypothetical protein ACE5I5_04590 [Candidatus Heimdallarchaeota archaeon]